MLYDFLLFVKLTVKEIKEKVLCSYPFAASLSSLLEEKLVIRVNDQEIETELHIERNGYDME